MASLAVPLRQAIRRLRRTPQFTAIAVLTLAIGIVASVLFGSIPILKYGGVRIGTRLREGGRSLSESRERHRARNGLVIIQVALALVLLISSGLMIRTFLALTHVPPGFTAPAEIQTFHVYIPDVEMKAPEQVARAEQEILQKLQALPGVSLAAFGRPVPMDGNGWNDPSTAHILLCLPRLFQDSRHATHRRPRLHLGRHLQQTPRSNRLRKFRPPVLA